MPALRAFQRAKLMPCRVRLNTRNQHAQSHLEQGCRSIEWLVWLVGCDGACMGDLSISLIPPSQLEYCTALESYLAKLDSVGDRGCPNSERSVLNSTVGLRRVQNRAMGESW